MLLGEVRVMHGVTVRHDVILGNQFTQDSKVTAAARDTGSMGIEGVSGRVGGMIRVKFIPNLN